MAYCSIVCSHEPYELSSIELTQKIRGRFGSVVELQNYILDRSVLQAEAELNAAPTKLLYTLLSVFLSFDCGHCYHDLCQKMGLCAFDTCSTATV